MEIDRTSCTKLASRQIESCNWENQGWPITPLKELERVHINFRDWPSIEACHIHGCSAIVEQEEFRVLLQGYGGVHP